MKASRMALAACAAALIAAPAADAAGGKKEGTPADPQAKHFVKKISVDRMTAHQAALQEIADAHDARPAQVALAWLLAQKPWIVPIPGTTQMPHLLENIGAASVTFTSTEIGELNAAVAAIEVRGQRLPDAVLAFSGVEAPEPN